MAENLNPELMDTKSSSPQELKERLERYLLETENLIAWLKDGLEKGESELGAIMVFDERLRSLGGDVTPIDTTLVVKTIEDIRTHIKALQDLRDRLESDLAKVEDLNLKIGDLLRKQEPTAEG